VRNVVAFTSLTFGYLSRGVLMARTLRQAHPDWTIVALVVDVRPAGFGDAALLAAFDEVVYAADLAIPHFAAWLFKHDVVEACTAVKGQMLCTLLARGADCVVYLDPDIAVFHGLDEVIDLLGGASIVLTPHQLDANDSKAAMQDNELTSLCYGVFNLGFLAVANDGVGRDFAAWWNGHLQRACYDEPERFVFTDQKYCDLVPALFDRVHVLRDPGYNVASWNLSRRRLSISRDGSISVNGAPLRFFHFTKIFGVGDVMSDRYGAHDMAVLELRHWYKSAVLAIDRAGAAPPPWHYGTFANGQPIPKAARILFRTRPDLAAHFSDPFAAAGNSFYEWLCRNAPDSFQPA